MPPKKNLDSGLLRYFLVYFGSIEQEFHELCKPLASRSRRSAVIKRDIEYCDRKCGVQRFPPRSLEERKVLRKGRTCREDSGVTP